MSGQQRNDGGGGFSAYLCLINHLWTLEAPGFISLSLFFFSCAFLLSSRPAVHALTEIPSPPWTPLPVSPPFFDFFIYFYNFFWSSTPFIKRLPPLFLLIFPPTPWSGPDLQGRRRSSSNSCSSPELHRCSHQPPTEPHTHVKPATPVKAREGGGKKNSGGAKCDTAQRQKP